MWSRSLLLELRVKAQGEGRRIRFTALIAPYVLTGLLLAWEPLLRCVPEAKAAQARAALDAALGVLWAVEEEEPQTYLEVDTEQEDGRIYARLRSRGMGRRKRL